MELLTVITNEESQHCSTGNEQNIDGKRMN